MKFSSSLLTLAVSIGIMHAAEKVPWEQLQDRIDSRSGQERISVITIDSKNYRAQSIRVELDELKIYEGS